MFVVSKVLTDTTLEAHLAFRKNIGVGVSDRVFACHFVFVRVGDPLYTSSCCWTGHANMLCCCCLKQCASMPFLLGCWGSWSSLHVAAVGGWWSCLHVIVLLLGLVARIFAYHMVAVVLAVMYVYLYDIRI